MESKEALKRIRREAGTPYFSTLYDIDMWRDDFEAVENDLDMLELIAKHLNRVPSIGQDANEYNDITLVMPGDYVEEAKIIERWLVQQWEAEKKKSQKITSEAELKSLIEFVEEYASEEELTSPNGVRSVIDKIANDLEVLNILKENHLEIDKDGNIYIGNKMDMMLGIEDYYKGEEESYNKIKECLENDN